MDIFWDITNKCNLRCKHCYNSEELELNNPELTLSECLSIINKLPKNSKIHFLGGEPLLKKGLEDIIALISKKKLTYSMTTNGLLLDNSTIEMLTNSNLNYIVFSIDGYNKETHEVIRGHNTFDNLLININKFTTKTHIQNKNIESYINVVLNKLNIDDLEQYFNIAKNLNVTGINFSRLFEEGSATNNNLSIDAHTWIEVCINLTKLNRIFDLNITISANPKVIKYINCKYNSNYKVVNNLCTFTTSKDNVYLRYDGGIFPCNKWYISNHKIENNAKNMDIEEITGYINNHPLHSETNNFYKKQLNYINDICIKCEFKKVCGFCIISKNYRNNSYYDECFIINKYINVFKESMIHKGVKFDCNNFAYTMQDEYILIEGKNKEFRLKLKGAGRNTFKKIFIDNESISDIDLDNIYNFIFFKFIYINE
ncbi:MAG: radical SAM protein [Paraclostridium sordellii]